MNTMRCYIPWIRLAIVVTSLTACSILPKPALQDIYRLPPSSVGATQGEGVNISLRITEPLANDLLRSKRIVVVPEGNRLSVYKGVRWSSPAPALWRDHLLEAFHNDGRIKGLSSAAERLQADIELGGELRAFQVEYRQGRPEVVIHLDAYLVDAGHKRIVASHRFAAREAVNGDQVPAVIDAFGRASDAIARELIDWTLDYAAASR